MDLTWKTKDRHEKLGSKRVATESKEKTQNEYASAAWKLKTDLDESYQQQKIETPSNQSEQVSAKQQVWSTILSEHHTTSIMQDHQQRNLHFFQMLRSKMPQYKARSKDQSKISLRDFNHSMPKPSRRSVDFKKESASLEKIKALKSKRSEILHQIADKIKEDEMSRMAEQSKNKCLSCMCHRQTQQKPSRIQIMKQMIFTLRKDQPKVKNERLLSNFAGLESKDKDLSLKKGGMMKNLINLKNKMIDSQTPQSSKTESPGQQGLFSRSQSPISQGCSWAKHKRTQCEPQSLQLYFTEGKKAENEQFTPIKKLTTFSRQEDTDFRSSQILKPQNFTFGELNKNKMKTQLQFMKRHMKKVSIELQQCQKSENRRLFT